MSGAQRTRRPSTRIQLSPKEANIYALQTDRCGLKVALVTHRRSALPDRYVNRGTSCAPCRAMRTTFVRHSQRICACTPVSISRLPSPAS